VDAQLADLRQQLLQVNAWEQRAGACSRRPPWATRQCRGRQAAHNSKGMILVRSSSQANHALMAPEVCTSSINALWSAADW
jgi:hypothetical protein